MRIGINPLTWSNDDMPELGGDIPLERCLKEAKEAGYEGVELGNKFPRKAEQLKPVVQKYGLQVISGWYSSALLKRSVKTEIDALEPHLSLLQAMGSKVLVLCETTGAVHGDKACPLSKRPRLTEREWTRLSDGLTKLGEHTARRGIKLAYHEHMGCVVQTAADIDQLMERCGPSVWLLLDAGHITFAGGDPVAIARKYGARIAHVHAKDIRRGTLERALDSNTSFLNAVIDGVFTVPGDGCVNFRGLFDVLASVLYEGWIVVEAEQDPAEAHPLPYASLGFKNLEKLARAAGLIRPAAALTSA
jgi:inosose dehydratase